MVRKKEKTMTISEHAEMIQNLTETMVNSIRKRNEIAINNGKACLNEHIDRTDSTEAIQRKIKIIRDELLVLSREIYSAKR